jgi:predicted helicase
MIESADWLCHKHFRKSLIDKQVEILDPAAGTGTFITELIEHFRGQPTKLRYKYLEELHANEVAILPYYVANLNIEATYATINGYEEYPNLCFVDTLDNTAALKAQQNQHVGDLFGGVSEENVARIKRQNKKKISVVIGNPPYNANQLNENENNKNREYPEIDRRIKATYIDASTAQKTKLYDMYARFFRWASDRVDENGIVAFITNRSFIENRTFDGFRKIVADDFNEIYVIDLGGDVRDDPRISGTKHNVFGIQTGVAISFLVKRSKAKGCVVRYTRRAPLETAEDKLAFLATAKFGSIKFDNIHPNARHDWLNLVENDFSDFLPIANKDTKQAKRPSQINAIFKLFSLGVSTNRDDWVIDYDSKSLSEKIIFFVNHYKSLLGNRETDEVIKWSETLRRRFRNGTFERYSSKKIRKTLYRPYCEFLEYDSEFYIDRPGLATQLFPIDRKNRAICFMSGDRQEFSAIAAGAVPNLNMFSADAIQYVSEERSDENGIASSNVTDWALERFRAHYEKGKTSKRPITKEATFLYVYAVLHDPIYREKYALNLKREFPRVPFYAEFWRWAKWGETLMALHIGYETVEPWPLERIDAPDEKSRKAGLAPKAVLRADKDTGNIQLDTETQLTGVPPEAWTYRLGNRSALEWILDQYKEKTPKDPTIREKFNTYRFADHKEKVIDLLKRVTRVSVETMKIVEAMRSEKR